MWSALRNWKGLACEANLSSRQIKKAHVGKISALKTMSETVHKALKQQNTPKGFARLQRRQNQNSLLICCCANTLKTSAMVVSSVARYKPLRLLQICVDKKTIFTVGTTRDWMEHLDHNKYWKVDMGHWLCSKVQWFICDWLEGMRIIYRTKIHTHRHGVATHKTLVGRQM